MWCNNVYAPIVDYWMVLYNGESQVVMVTKKNDDGEVAVFSNSLLALFKEGV